VAILESSEIRQRFAAALAALSTDAEPWKEAPAHYDLFPSDTRSHAHLAFAVGVPSSVFDSAKETYRGARGAEGGAATTAIGIRWTYLLRTDSQVADYDSGCDSAVTLLIAIAGTSKTALHFAPGRVSRRTVGDGTYMLSEVLIECRNRRAIR
jgi:hypothetical protein